MKITIENLQQKLEEKDKEKLKIRNEGKLQVLELKQDKKRYEELLNLRDAEMLKMNAQVKILEG